MQAELAALLHATREALDNRVDAWDRVDLTADEWGEEVAALLADAHTRAVVIGRTHAGDDAPEEADDREYAERIVYGDGGEAEYLVSFVADLAGDRYLTDDGVDTAAIKRRARLYAGKLVGTANDAWVLTLPETTVYQWHLGQADGSHCTDCPRIAAGSPYHHDSLPTVPGAGKTSCLANCRCWLETGTGQTGFRLPELSEG